MPALSKTAARKEIPRGGVAPSEIGQNGFISKKRIVIYDELSE